jgi:flavin-dependent dehydrogenase
MKVCVLGAGPAGSTAAYYLAQRGMDVELIDKTNFPREKPCAGGLFNPLLFDETFPHVKEFDGKDIFKVKFHCGLHTTEYTSQKPLMRTTLRRNFDLFLLNKAVEAGAKFHIGRIPEGDLLINATGARYIRDYPETGICLVNDFEMDKDIDTAHVHYAFRGIKGYCWLYPKKGYVSIGTGAYLPQRNIKDIYKRYIDFLRDHHIVSTGNYAYRAKIIPFAPVKRYHTDNSLIVGDAAGFVKPGTGEGIFFAMLSGKIAAQTLIEGRDLSWYGKRCKVLFGEFLKPVTFSWSRRLLNRMLEKAITICENDATFRRMIAENYFRLANHNLSGKFIRNIFG